MARAKTLRHIYRDRQPRGPEAGPDGVQGTKASIQGLTQNILIPEKGSSSRRSDREKGGK